MSRPAIDRIWDKVVVHPLGCWEFTGSLTPRGYGHVSPGEASSSRAHRIVYESYIGPIPEGLTLDHLCHNPRCVNPAHLEPVTREENTRRQWRDGRARNVMAERMREKTQCANGHDFTPENTARLHGDGYRYCKTCRRERARRRYQEKNA